MYAAILLVFGLTLLYFGAEWLIKSSSTIALRMGVSSLIVGLTIVGFGTSSPELLVSIRAAILGNPGIALGNVVGSNICNLALILGLSSFIRPVSINQKLLSIDVPIMIGCCLLLIVILYDAVLTRLEGVILFSGFLLYIGYNVYEAHSKKEVGPRTAEETAPARRNIFYSGIIMIAGLAMLVLGAHLFVEGAIRIAGMLGMSDVVIGLTIVALGTSLPELATSMVAAFKDAGDISTGNVIGSNIFNILAIVGITAIIHPIGDTDIGRIDLGVMLGIALIVFPMMRTESRVNRGEGAFLLVCYIAYTLYLLV